MSENVSVIDGVIPVISVAMPVYNGERYLAEAIDSILAQTFADFELIIIDDGSTDNSLLVLREYQKRDSRIRLIARENRNLATTLNDIIDLARGKWVARMDQDDIALPHRFERQLQCLDQTGADICGSWIQFFGAGERRIRKPFHTDEAIKIDMLFKCPLAHPSVVMRAELIKRLRYDKAWEKAEDYELWTRAVKAGWRFTNVQEVLLMYRKHREQISSATYNKQQLLTIEINKNYWLYMAGEIGLNKNKVKDILSINYAHYALDMDNVDFIIESLLNKSSGESRKAVAQGAERIYYKVAADCTNVVSRWLKLNKKFGEIFSAIMILRLMFLRFFRIRFGGQSHYRLVKLYSFFK